MNDTEARVPMKLGKVSDDLWIVLDGKNRMRRFESETAARIWIDMNGGVIVEVTTTMYHSRPSFGDR